MEKLITHTYRAGVMSCGGCPATVKDHKLSLLQGVTPVNVSLDKKRGEVTSPMEIKKEHFRRP